MACLLAYMYRQISKCTDKTPKKHYGGGGQLPPPPCPHLATLVNPRASKRTLVRDLALRARDRRWAHIVFCAPPIFQNSGSALAAHYPWIASRKYRCRTEAFWRGRSQKYLDKLATGFATCHILVYNGEAIMWACLWNENHHLAWHVTKYPNLATLPIIKSIVTWTLKNPTYFHYFALLQASDVRHIINHPNIPHFSFAFCCQFVSEVKTGVEKPLYPGTK